MLNNSRVLVDSYEMGGVIMGEFTKDPGGHKVVDPGGGGI